MRRIATALLVLMAIAFCTQAPAEEKYPTIFPEGDRDAAKAFEEGVNTDWGEANKDNQQAFLTKWIQEWNAFFDGGKREAMPHGAMLYKTEWGRAPSREFFYITGFDEDGEAIWKKGSHALARGGEYQGFVLEEVRKMDLTNVDAHSFFFINGFNWMKTHGQQERLLQLAAFLYRNADDQKEDEAKEAWLWGGNRAMTAYLRNVKPKTKEHQEGLEYIRDQHEWDNNFMDPEKRVEVTIGAGTHEFFELMPSKLRPDRIKSLSTWTENELKLVKARMDARGDTLGLSWAQIAAEHTKVISAAAGSQVILDHQKAYQPYKEAKAEDDKRAMRKLEKDLDDNAYYLGDLIAEKVKAVDDAATEALELGKKGEAAGESGDTDEESEKYEAAIEKWQEIYGFGKFKGEPLDPYFLDRMIDAVALLQKAAKPDRFYKRCDHEQYARYSVELCDKILLYKHMDITPRIFKGVAQIMTQDLTKSRRTFEEAKEMESCTADQKRIIEKWEGVLDNLERSR